ncbi:MULTISPECIES: class I SAM-dependent methyltransferase [Cyanophyceae]|uniref:class I SAM-dependent methyltransferase n=1 Tax=Cyanophyceae TaxID=3028117 RepID=UPI001687731A|nr:MULTISPECIES: class I SAM-dependent methyltransferase [unclassified Phormidium]MBD1914711.1 class I SAM-dependent methyltransferase [Phormidium sp. FACHB-77]MBD2032203.1 class I SAM-dependent methyltransferase [Phormidium sp. FACHB-322]MBD2049206.1 class I SAM-dependent methyltransferase [Leptolyngbya sp. FACHB-60]
MSERLTSGILRLGQATPDTTFFEPGIGTGRIALPIVERGYVYTGVDISEAMMDKLRQKLEGKAHRLTLINADTTELPFGANAFDVAIAPHILHLIPNWQTAMDELRRVLKSIGVFIYFHHPTNKTATRDAIGRQWRQILAGYGYDSGFTGGVTEDVLGRLQEQGAELETVMVAELSRESTVDSLMRVYRDRIYSNMWRVPDNIYPQALADLEDWAVQEFPDPNQPITSQDTITLTAAYHWAG